MGVVNLEGLRLRVQKMLKARLNFLNQVVVYSTMQIRINRKAEMQIIVLEENSRTQVVTISITCRGNAKLKIITIHNPLQTLNNNYSSKILKAIRQKRQILSERPKKLKPRRRPKSVFRTGLSATAKPRIDRRARFSSVQSTSPAITAGSSFNFAPYFPSSMSMNKPFSTLRKPRVWPLS